MLAVPVTVILASPAISALIVTLSPDADALAESPSTETP